MNPAELSGKVGSGLLKSCRGGEEELLCELVAFSKYALTHLHPDTLYDLSQVCSLCNYRGAVYFVMYDLTLP